MNDDQLMTRIAAGEEAAFRLLVERWERQVHAFHWRMTASREEAEDLTQDTFLKVHAHAGGYRPEGRFKSWLFRIAGNLSRSWARRRKIVGWVRFDLDVHDRAGREPAPDAVVAGEQLRQRLQRALAGLPPRQREALVLRRYHDLSQRDIAAAMGTSEGAVESLLVRALETLRRELVPEPGAG
ncbi:MAG: sigma-70 family RNA polymerase sigma factor [bacterium]|nr:sigma-70 family RNA polymerase sigma factor [bacterium]